MKVGITGTRSGMNDRQYDAVYHFLSINKKDIEEFHHGDCVGVDVEAAQIAKNLGIKVICHPPIKTQLRAFHESHEHRPPLTYFARNRNIVNETDILLVVPWQDEHQNSGGTWYTHDYAKKKNKHIKLFTPSFIM